MKQYYFDTSVLLVYTLTCGTEVDRYPSVQKLFNLIESDQLKSITSFYALHELYIFALENAPDFEIGSEYGKAAMNMILSSKIHITPLLNRIERKINERFFKHLPDISDLPHAISAKLWGCDGIVAYDIHFKSISDVLEHKTPDDILIDFNYSEII